MMNKKVFFVILIVVCLCLFASCSKKASVKEDVFKMATDYLKQATTVTEICSYQYAQIKEMGSSSYDINGWYKDANGAQRSFEVVMNKENGVWKVGYNIF